MTCKFRVHGYAQSMIPSGVCGSVCVEKNRKENFTKTHIFKKLGGEVTCELFYSSKKCPAFFTMKFYCFIIFNYFLLKTKLFLNLQFQNL